ncbi:M56 family metallopeptidase [Hymenobacter sp. H14-R3]|uniref:M56 family metallopeptidase n=1 Tax=Hymenobacter sp. H14-R3 TaxID=3046308 RepID=UPI0024B92C11|nr:M56 family metallopeptidase [Hymenobacter sp. H14-R3]MDJ0366433.1 M56 family metallopeptidase [Hymenobacter sp. H14-R3]
MNAFSLLPWLAGTLLPLGGLWLLFRVALRGEQCFGYNRVLLLLAPVLAAGLPLLPQVALPGWLATSRAPGVVLAVVLPALQSAAPAPAATGVSWGWLVWLYAAGVGVGLARLAYRGWQLRRATRRLPREARPGYALAYTGGRLPTSSFGRTVFWDETAALTPAEATAVLDHELAHVRQGHSYDVLWLEMWRLVLWPNPFAHLLLPALRLTHELLADQAASPAVAAQPYATLLARLALGQSPRLGYSALIQSFNFYFTLTRIAMLQTQNPVRRWKQWLVLPVLGGLSLVACQKTSPDAVQPTVAKEVRKGIFMAKVKEAMRQDSLANGGKGWRDERSVLNMNVDKDGKVTITHQPTAPPPLTPLTTSELAAQSNEATRIYTYVEQMPALPGGGGMGAIVEQIQRNVVYPAGAHQDGKVFVSFTVAADGGVADTKVVKGLAPAYDAAVVAAIRQLPRFVPGQQSGKAVAVSFTVPVMFKEEK